MNQLYCTAATAGDGSHQSLYSLDDSGAPTAIAPLLDGSSGAYALCGIAFHPLTGILYGLTNPSFSPTHPGWIVSIDHTTGVVTPIAACPFAVMGFLVEPYDIAFDSIGQLWINFSPGNPTYGATSATINLTSGALTPQTPTLFAGLDPGFVTVNGTAIDASDVLFGQALDGNINDYLLHSWIGADHAIGSYVPAPVGQAYMAFRVSGELFVQNSGHLITLDPVTLAQTPFAVPALTDMTGIAFGPSLIDSTFLFSGGDATATTQATETANAISVDGSNAIGGPFDPSIGGVRFGSFAFSIESSEHVATKRVLAGLTLSALANGINRRWRAPFG